MFLTDFLGVAREHAEDALRDASSDGQLCQGKRCEGCRIGWLEDHLWQGFRV